jgi:hypothetical protein
MAAMRDVLPYREPVVRDLAWALASPALLRRIDAHVCWPEDTWYSGIGRDYADRLAALDRDPSALYETVDAEKDRRLGKYFEQLWRFWLLDNPRYRMLHANLAVRSNERTLGEFDLLVEDRVSRRHLHWELALKFYLGVGDTREPANWWGPALRDRLDLKTERMLNHQSRLSKQPQAAALLRQLGVRIDETWLIVKGRLFYPRHQPRNPPHGAGHAHERGFWQTRSGFLKSAAVDDAHWLELGQRQWLSPLAAGTTGDAVEGAALAERPVGQPLARPLCVARIIAGSETSRGFVVPDDWCGEDAQSS